MEKRWKRWPWLLVSVFVLVLDAVSKWWVVNNLAWGDVKRVTPFLNIRLALNKGAAFGFLDSSSGWQIYLLAILAIAVAVLMLIWFWRAKHPSHWMLVALCLIIGGAIGNAIDRIANGVVVDFIDFHVRSWHYATFNVADIAITIGVICLLIDWMFIDTTKLRQS